MPLGLHLVQFLAKFMSHLFSNRHNALFYRGSKAEHGDYLQVRDKGMVARAHLEQVSYEVDEARGAARGHGVVAIQDTQLVLRKEGQLPSDEHVQEATQRLRATKEKIRGMCSVYLLPESLRDTSCLLKVTQADTNKPGTALRG